MREVWTLGFGGEGDNPPFPFHPSRRLPLALDIGPLPSIAVPSRPVSVPLEIGLRKSN